MDSVRTCPRCRGNVFLERDMTDGEWYEYCLQCSYRHYLLPMAEPERETSGAGLSKRKRRKKKRSRRTKADE